MEASAILRGLNTFFSCQHCGIRSFWPHEYDNIDPLTWSYTHMDWKMVIKVRESCRWWTDNHVWTCHETLTVSDSWLGCWQQAAQILSPLPPFLPFLTADSRPEASHRWWDQGVRDGTCIGDFQIDQNQQNDSKAPAYLFWECQPPHSFPHSSWSQNTQGLSSPCMQSWALEKSLGQRHTCWTLHLPSTLPARANENW